MSREIDKQKKKLLRKYNQGEDDSRVIEEEPI